MNTALLSRQTGRIYYLTDMGDPDDDIPEDAIDSDEYIGIPHRNDLGLGTSVVRRFIRSEAPEMNSEVDRIFRRKGACARYTALLCDLGLLEAWYEYENTQATTALQEWCSKNGARLSALDLGANDTG